MKAEVSDNFASSVVLTLEHKCAVSGEEVYIL